jgi:hypothetical protein
MPKLTELTSKKHKDLKIAPQAHIKHAAKQHVVQLSAAEIANAATCFPVFVTRNNVNGGWVVSAMTSFELDQNLYVNDDSWSVAFNPASLRTYPLYLMQSPDNEKSFTVGFNEESDAFSTTDGIDLFQADGSATEHLTDVTRMLETELTNVKQTFEFGNVLDKLGLLKEIDLKVQYQDGTTNVIKGLHTINEDTLQTIDAEKLAQLNKIGYLTPIHALLISIFQLNVLVNKHNANDGKMKVKAVKMEVSKDPTLN